MAAISVAEKAKIWSRRAWLVITRTKPPRITKESANTVAKSADKRKPSVRKNLFRTQNISRAAHGVDQLAAETAIHLAAQPAHMGFHDIGARIEMQVPDIFQQHGAGHHPAHIAHQIFQQPEFLGLQLDRFAAAMYGTPDQIHFQVRSAKAYRLA